MFGVDMITSVHDDNKKKYILILGQGLTQGLYGTTLTAEKNYSINFTVLRKNFCLSLYYNGANSYLLVNDTKINKFKVKDFEINPTPLCLGKILKDFSADNMKKAGYDGFFFYF